MADIEITPTTVTAGAPGTQASVNDGTTVTLPTVAAPSMPIVEGVGLVNEVGAEVEILHHLVGAFRQGDRVTVATLGGKAVDLSRLIALGAVKMIGDVASAVNAASAPQKPKGK